MKSDYVIGIGGIAVDKFYRTEYFPNIGEKTMMNFEEEIVGGMVPNVLFNLASMGKKTYLIDTFPQDDTKMQIAYDELDKYDVDYSHCIKDPSYNIFETMIINNNKDRAIFIVNPGFPQLFEISDETYKLIENASYVHTVLPFAKQMIGFEKYFDEWVASGVKFVFDMEPGTFASYEEDKKYFDGANILVFNEYGFKQFVGERNEVDVINHFKSSGQTVIITLGKEGAKVISDHQLLRLEGIPTTVIDPTGAGDCFNSVFINELLDGKSIDDAAVHANKKAAEFVSILGPKFKLK